MQEIASAHASRRTAGASRASTPVEEAIVAAPKRAGTSTGMKEMRPLVSRTATCTSSSEVSCSSRAAACSSSTVIRWR